MLMMASASLDDSTHTNSRTVAPSKKKQVSLVTQTTTAIMISRSFVAEGVLASRVLCCLASIFSEVIIYRFCSLSSHFVCCNYILGWAVLNIVLVFTCLYCQPWSTAFFQIDLLEFFVVFVQGSTDQIHYIYLRYKIDS